MTSREAPPRPVGQHAPEPVKTPSLGMAVWHIVRKDWTVESRSREIAYTTLFFAVSCLLVFAFAIVREGKAPEGAGEGVLWATLTFAGMLALGRTFERERQAETLRALLLAPVPRAAVYLGKLVGITGLLFAVEVILTPLVSLLFAAPLLSRPLWLLAILLTGTLGFASVGTLFAAMLVRARSRDVLLPVLLCPVVVPVLIAGVRGTSALVAPEFDVAIARFWLALLVAFDVVFVTLALWTFELVMAE
jgi:heme exporter protein B